MTTHTIEKASNYWKKCWNRLKQNKAALCSLFAIMFTLALVLIGPLLWQLDPVEQNLNRISEPPSLRTQAVIVEDCYAENSKPDNITALSALCIPSTVSVSIAWPKRGNSYVISRVKHKSNLSPIVLDTIEENYFDDKINVEEGQLDYFITYEDNTTQTITIDVQKGIPIAEAQLKNPNAKVGDKILLSAHPFGTDYLGRDVFARVLSGARISLFIGIIAPIIYIIIGILIGGLSGYIGGKVDFWLISLIDFISVFPFLLFMILFRVALGVGPGENGITIIVLSFIILCWTDAARLMRGQALQFRETEYIQAAKAFGAKPVHILVKHIIPNTIGVLIVLFTLSIPSTIFAEAFLSFIGMGVVSPSISLGSLCREGLYSLLLNPYELFFPSLFIIIVVLAINLLGSGLRDAFDPKTKFKV